MIGIALAAFATPEALAEDGSQLLLFGGHDHKVFLGCLSCPKHYKDSVFNHNGPFGACSPGQNNLYCRRFQSRWVPGLQDAREEPLYGSSHSDLSACNESATGPPVMVSTGGKYYGRFSVAEYGHEDSACRKGGRYYSERACQDVKWICTQDDGGTP